MNSNSGMISVENKDSIYRIYEMMVKNQQIFNKHAVNVTGGSDKLVQQQLLNEKNSVLLKGKVV